MKNRYQKIFLCIGMAIMLLAFCAGCSKKNQRIADKSKIAECTWFAQKAVDKEYRLDKISFSEDDNIAMLSYVPSKIGIPLDKYYVVYATEKKGDGYKDLKKVEFEEAYYPMWAYISYSGKQVIFTGIPREQAKDQSGFENGCNLYIGDFSDYQVTNIRQIEDSEVGKRYYVLSLLEDGSILYNVYDDKKDEFQLKYLKHKEDGTYEPQEIHHEQLDDYYCIQAYVDGGKAFLWRADATDRTFDGMQADFSDGVFTEVKEVPADFMAGKSYKNFYSTVGYDRTGGLYFYEMDREASKLKLYRSPWVNEITK